MGIRDDRDELEAWRDKKPLPPWKDGSGRTGRFIQSPGGEWILHPALPPVGTSFVEILPNGEVRQYSNASDGDTGYQIVAR